MALFTSPTRSLVGKFRWIEYDAQTPGSTLVGLWRSFSHPNRFTWLRFGKGTSNAQNERVEVLAASLGVAGFFESPTSEASHSPIEHRHAPSIMAHPYM